LKSRQDRIKKIAEAAHTAKAAQEAVDATNTVLLIAVMIPILFD
jgi:hypothetical protein